MLFLLELFFGLLNWQCCEVNRMQPELKFSSETKHDLSWEYLYKYYLLMDGNSTRSLMILRLPSDYMACPYLLCVWVLFLTADMYRFSPSSPSLAVLKRT